MHVCAGVSVLCVNYNRMYLIVNNLPLSHQSGVDYGYGGNPISISDPTIGLAELKPGFMVCLTLELTGFC